MVKKKSLLHTATSDFGPCGKGNTYLRVWNKCAILCFRHYTIAMLLFFNHSCRGVSDTSLVSLVSPAERSSLLLTRKCSGRRTPATVCI